MSRRAPDTTAAPVDVFGGRSEIGDDLGFEVRPDLIAVVVDEYDQAIGFSTQVADGPKGQGKAKWKETGRRRGRYGWANGRESWTTPVGRHRRS